MLTEALLLHAATVPRGSGTPHYRCFTITLSKTPLDE